MNDGRLPLPRIREQRELRDHQRFPADRREVEIRLALVVAEDPQAGDLGGQRLGVALGVVVTHADQQEVAEPDRGHLDAVHRNGGPRHPLEHDAH